MSLTAGLRTYYGPWKVAGPWRKKPRKRAKVCLRGHVRTPQSTTKHGTCKLCQRELARIGGKGAL